MDRVIRDLMGEPYASLGDAPEQLCLNEDHFSTPSLQVCRFHFLNLARISVTQRGGRNKGGRKQMRANANKRRQTQRQTQRSKCEQTRANVDKRKQTLTLGKSRMSGSRTSGSSRRTSGSSGSCRLFLHFLGKIAVRKMSGRTPGSPRHSSSRHPRPSDTPPFIAVFTPPLCTPLIEKSLLRTPDSHENLGNCGGSSSCAEQVLLGKSFHSRPGCRRKILSREFS